MATLNHSMRELSTQLHESKQQTSIQLQLLLNSTKSSVSGHSRRTSAELADHTHSMNNSLEAVNKNLSQHTKQVANKLANLQTFLVNHMNIQLQELGTRLSEGLQQATTGVNGTISSHSHRLHSKLKIVQRTMLNLQRATESSLDGQTRHLDGNIAAVGRDVLQHKELFTAEIAALQTSLNSTHSSLETAGSKLDSLTANTAQLSSQYRRISNLSSKQCSNADQYFQLRQKNFKQQLRKIQADVSFIREEHSCGGHGWRRVVYLDMTNPNTTCPSGWKLTGYSQRTCGRNSTAQKICNSATFPVSGGEYSRVCGRIRAYQWGATVGFYSYHEEFATTIDGPYVCGVSVTHGTPRNHIWTFAAGGSEGNRRKTWVCPCSTGVNNTIDVPGFVDGDYFCESGVNERWNGRKHYTLHSNDTLWDGEDCPVSKRCCSYRNPPYFYKQLTTSTTDDIEARICLLLHTSDVAVELMELYVR